MPTITLCYELSAAGRRAALLAGQSPPANGTSEVQIDHTSLLWARVIALLPDTALVDGATLRLYGSTGLYDAPAETTNHTRYDEEPTAERLISDEETRRAAVAAWEAQKEERFTVARTQRLDAIAVLTGDALLNAHGGFAYSEDDLEAAGRLAEARVFQAQWRASEEARLADEREAEQQVAAREAAERLTWIARHGSPRLQRLVEEGIEHRSVYLDERLALERPYWEWKLNGGTELREPRNASAEALDLLDEARATLPEEQRAEARLCYYVVKACDAEHAEGRVCPGYHDGYRGYAVEARFLDRTILYTAHTEEEAADA